MTETAVVCSNAPSSEAAARELCVGWGTRPIGRDSFADDLVEQPMLATSGQYQCFGGADHDANFRWTNVFFGSEALTDAAVALELLSKQPLGAGRSRLEAGHGRIARAGGPFGGFRKCSAVVCVRPE